jgi:CRISPR-associated protein Csb2
MARLNIAWEYLTGYAVATDSSTRDRAEWPPHPARVFMALAAAWFETKPNESDDYKAKADWTSEGAALRWLESLGDPEMLLPDVERCCERSAVTFYVPINDRAGPSAATLQSAPTLTRSKQPRSFPRIWVGNALCVLSWPEAEGLELHRLALDRLCRKVTRLGHSSSLVAMRVSVVDDHPTPKHSRFVRDDLQPELHVRSLSRGMLDMLVDRFGEVPRQRYATLRTEIEDLKAERKAVRGGGSKERRANIDERAGLLESELSTIQTRPPVRPVTGLWTAYRRTHSGSRSSELQSSIFDSDILILSQIAGPRLPVVSTLLVTRALRDTIMAETVQPVPSWVSGLASDGQPLRDANGHLALVPLPFVGRDHADGHLLGVALIFPRSVPYTERGRVLGSLLVDENALPKRVRLKLAHLGDWDVQKRDWQELRATLQPEQWTSAAAAKGSTTWASVTPVVLDRFPNSDRRDPAQRVAWEEEARQVIGNACQRIGLPEPEIIEIGTTSWFLGSPRAIGKRRPLRGTAGSGGRDDAALGDGFPPYAPRESSGPRPQVHVWLSFSRPVVGPVVLGAGRYLGYGLCKPFRRGRT